MVARFFTEVCSISGKRVLQAERGEQLNREVLDHEGLAQYADGIEELMGLPSLISPHTTMSEQFPWLRDQPMGGTPLITLQVGRIISFHRAPSAEGGKLLYQISEVVTPIPDAQYPEGRPYLVAQRSYPTGK